MNSRSAYKVVLIKRIRLIKNYKFKNRVRDIINTIEYCFLWTYIVKSYHVKMQLNLIATGMKWMKFIVVVIISNWFGKPQQMNLLRKSNTYYMESSESSLSELTPIIFNKYGVTSLRVGGLQIKFVGKS